MRNKTRFILSVVLIIPMAAAFFLGSGPANSGGPASPGGIDLSSYPEIGDEEMGQLLWALKIADQPLDDFSNMEAMNQEGMTAYRYFIAFSTYFLATEQYHKLPACSEIIQPRIDGFIQKMIQKPVWEFWAEVSKGVRNLEPYLNKPYPSNRDPVIKENIMYSGHVGHMIGLYETLYRDMKWDEPGSIVFKWDENEKYVYDNHSLQKVMYDQMKYSKDHCVPCEPNACFPECNQHPVLSFILYDHAHGASLSEVKEDFLDFFLKNNMIDPRNHETAALFLVKQEITLRQNDPRFGNLIDVLTVPAVKLRLLSLTSASANGWTGSMMHAWQPEYIERHYPFQKEHHYKIMQDGEAELKRDFFEPRLYYGFFSILASEVGDLEVRDTLIKKADEMYGPSWNGGYFSYPFDRDIKCVPLTGQLLALARANPKYGLWKMHNEPFSDEHFNSPKVTGLHFPAVLLKRAIYDPEKKALIITATPGEQKSGKTTFSIDNLNPKSSYALYVDDGPAMEYSGDRSVIVTIDIGERRDIVLIEKG